MAEKEGECLHRRTIHHLVIRSSNTDMQSVGSRFAGGAYYFVVMVVVGCGGQ